MILDKDIHPERRIYYLGAMILEIVKKSPKEELDFFDVYTELINLSKIKISVILYVLALDWLYILGAIRNKSGVIEKCF